MRLIDADKLRAVVIAMATDGDIAQPYVDKFGVVGAIDAAPTIGCETCSGDGGMWCDNCWGMRKYEPVCEKCEARVSVDFSLCGRCADQERAEAERGKVEAVVSLDDIDAQPVISCETCRNDELPMVSQVIRCQGCMCGSLYEPKEQT